jgi:hypothetical protein
MSILKSNLQYQIEIELNLPGSVAPKKRSTEEVGYHGRHTMASSLQRSDLLPITAHVDTEEVGSHGRHTMASSLQRSDLLPITAHVDTEGRLIALDKRYKQRKLPLLEAAWRRKSQLGQCNAGRWRACVSTPRLGTREHAGKIVSLN